MNLFRWQWKYSRGVDPLAQVPGQGDAPLGGSGAYLSVQLHTWHVLDAPEVTVLHTPNVLQAHLV